MSAGIAKVIPDYRLICADCDHDNGPVSKVKYGKNKMPILPVCQCGRSLFYLINPKGRD
jgi:hypothetical protein